MHGFSSLMLTQESPTLTRMVRADDGSSHNNMVSKEEGSTPSTYDIIMVSVSGSLLLLVAICVVVSVFRRHCTSKYSSKNLGTPVVVENVAVTKCSCEKISTVDLSGPVCLSYIADSPHVSPEFAISEENLSIFELPFFSFAVALTAPDSTLEK